MRPSNWSSLLLSLVLCPWFLLSTHGTLISAQRSTYIVHMDKSFMPKAFTTSHNWHSSTVDSVKSTETKTSDDRHSVSQLLYSYDNALDGFSAVLTKDELESLKKLPGFVSSYPDRKVTKDTTHTTEFLGLSHATGLWPASHYGKDVIIGVIDTGVWPESKSFADDGMTAIPSKWKGTCEEGQDFNSSLCNLKLIGARYFNKGLLAANPGIKLSMNSARDTEGHGTHTSSTAGGNYVEDASFFGYALGTARGVAPRARVAMYKVLWDEGGYASDVIAGMEKAVADGGVLVSSSAGNEGPELGRLHNGIPWVLTVAAGSIDRWFAGTLTLGNGLAITGWSMFPASAVVDDIPLRYNKTLSSCIDSRLLSQAPSSIIICDNTWSFFIQSRVLANSRMKAAIFISDDLEIFEFNVFPFPGIVISSKDGRAVIKYVESNGANSTASMSFQQTFVGTKGAPAVAAYTSRGPAPSFPGILKPDVMAPGTLVLAAWNPTLVTARIESNLALSSDYNIISGTSMACPHASGIAALLKGAHPKWSPAAIRSAMVTTASPNDNTLHPIRDIGQGFDIATPLAMGAGQVRPNMALDPGLIYDATTQDYVNLICSMNFTKNQRFERVVTNVGAGAATYKAKVTAPLGSSVMVSPDTLVFQKPNEKKAYSVTIHYNGDKNGTVTFGSLVWIEENGAHTVRSPIVVAPIINM
ncbi:hypothetical protein RHSIM_Rhsim06G0052500 [Rhododendron simsii]|uniref:Subtilisin-like protease SBT1.9 n=1 Tax=Rhododendron simsii TaxID=118357 RepID=A0A834LMY5_RHOSS|nr:hypothetical protein RHSIM_Rhsim06G0052500 [Rhododendron simsii]